MEGSAQSPEAFYDAAYPRMLRATLVLGLLGTAVAFAIFGWRAGVGVALGSLAGYLNFRWLHRGTELMVEHMLKQSSRHAGLKLWVAFVVRYALVIACIYAIFKGSTLLFYGFLIALGFPIVAAIGEGVYEAVAPAPSNQISN